MTASDFELLPLALGWGKGTRLLDLVRCCGRNPGSCLNQSATYKQKPWCPHLSHSQEAKGAKPS